MTVHCCVRGVRGARNGWMMWGGMKRGPTEVILVGRGRGPSMVGMPCRGETNKQTNKQTEGSHLLFKIPTGGGRVIGDAE